MLFVTVIIMQVLNSHITSNHFMNESFDSVHLVGENLLLANCWKIVSSIFCRMVFEQESLSKLGL